MRTLACTTLYVVLLLAAPTAWAQVGLPPVAAGPAGPGAGSRGPGHGVPNFLGQVFPPELVMQHQAEIGLTSAQRKAITAAMNEAHATVVEAQWDIQAASQQLGQLLGVPRIDESAALAQIDRVMEAEHKVKRAHFSLLIRVKNQLEPEQQARLREVAPNPGAYFNVVPEQRPAPPRPR